VSAKDPKAAKPLDYRIKEGGPLSGAWKIAFGVGGLGLAGAAAGFAMDPKRFAFSYLFAFFCLLTPALGALFFVFIQFLTSAGWSVSVRRTADFMLAGIPAILVLSLPVLVTAKTLYPWIESGGVGGHQHAEHGAEHSALTLEGTAHAQEHAAPAHGEATHEAEARHGEGADRAPGTHSGGGAHQGGHGGGPDFGYPSELANRPAVEHAEHAMHAATLDGKRGFLNTTFFYIRAVIYLLAWGALARAFFKWSTDQDKNKSLELTAKAQRLAPLAAVLFGLTLTLAGIDWVMGLDPLWYSTMFGVHIFAGAVVSMFAIMVVLTRQIQAKGLVGDAINVEHFHDLGKLLFGFNCFWSYIAFAEFFLIWYSNIPEETSFFFKRWQAYGESWKAVSLTLAVMHFAVPFVLLMSRNVKRKPELLTGLAVLLLVIHCLEYYWLVLPNYGPLSVSWIDIACLLGVGGVYFGLVLKTMTQYPLIPVGDPRLERALTFEQV
jgi:hypothetical protein